MLTSDKMASGLRSSNNNVDKQMKNDRNWNKLNFGDLINNSSYIHMHNCGVWDSGISNIDLYLQMQYVSQLHARCMLDNDASAQIYKYLFNASSKWCVHGRVYCTGVLLVIFILSRVDESIQKLKEHIESSLRALCERPQDRTYALVVAHSIAIPSSKNTLTQ